MMEKNISLGHGSGGRLMHSLIRDLFVKYFDNPFLAQQSDSAVLDLSPGKTAFTTDSYVIDPVFFPGGDIGKLAVCGTANDLAVAGATPRYITAAFIIEEGLPMEELERIVASMAEEAKNAGILVVTGDTKVVNKGQCDKIFINTAGIGQLETAQAHIGTGKNMEAGDKIILNGPIAQHGMAIMAVRNFGNFNTNIQSDCGCLNHMIREVLDTGARVRFMRDATRGGLATVMCEMAAQRGFGVEVSEEDVPVDDNVRGMCELLGFDPFYVANEGKLVMAVHPEDADQVIRTMKNNPLGRDAAVIGELTREHPGKAVLQTAIGGKRIMDMLAGEQLPRIC